MSLASAIRRRSALVVALAAFVLGGCATGDTASPAAGAAVTCPVWSTRDYAEARVIRHLRVHTNPTTGDSAIEDSVLKPKATPLLKTGRILVEYDFGPGSKTQLVYGPGNLDIPLHPAPYKESFLILHGSVEMRLGDGTVRQLVPGDLTTYEDTDASRGHGGKVGPCGYVALNIVP